MARKIWRNLLALLYRPEQPEGFRSISYGTRVDGTSLEEIPWISTNFTAQWCLKVIVPADLIPGAEPETFAELDRALREHPPEYGLYGA